MKLTELYENEALNIARQTGLREPAVGELLKKEKLDGEKLLQLITKNKVERMDVMQAVAGNAKGRAIAIKKIKKAMGVK